MLEYYFFETCKTVRESSFLAMLMDASCHARCFCFVDAILNLRRVALVRYYDWNHIFVKIIGTRYAYEDFVILFSSENFPEIFFLSLMKIIRDLIFLQLFEKIHILLYAFWAVCMKMSLLREAVLIETFDKHIDLYLFLQTATAIGRNISRDLFWPMAVFVYIYKWGSICVSRGSNV